MEVTQEIRNTIKVLSAAIEEIAEHSSNYTVSNRKHLKRRRKWDSATLIFILYFGSNSLCYVIS